MNTILAEWTKLRSTASFWWTTAVAIVGSVATTALFMALLPPEGGAFITADVGVAGFQTFGFIALMVQAIMVVTTEYRFGLPSRNFLGTPQRWQVALAKVVLYAVLAAVITLISIALSYLTVMLLLSEPITYNPFSDPQGQHFLWSLTVIMILLTFFVQGLGWMIRHTAGAITLALLWHFVFESIIGILPRIGADLLKYLPFHNMNAFMLNEPVAGTTWDPLVSLGIFAVWSIGMWIVGVIVLHRRDA